MQRRGRLKILTPVSVPARKPYVLNDQVGFLFRVAMQRHTAIFTSRMIEGLTQTQFAALAKLFEAGPCSQNHLGRLIYLDAATIKSPFRYTNLVGRIVSAGSSAPMIRAVAHYL